MVETLKILGQLDPNAATEGELYLASGVSATISTLTICNRGAATTVRVRVAKAGAGASDEQYLLYDAPIDASDSKFLTIGVTLAATDKIYVYSNSGNVAFQIFGLEVS